MMDRLLIVMIINLQRCVYDIWSILRLHVWNSLGRMKYKLLKMTNVTVRVNVYSEVLCDIVNIINATWRSVCNVRQVRLREQESVFSSCYACCRTSYGPYTIVFVVLCVLSHVLRPLYNCFRRVIRAVVRPTDLIQLFSSCYACCRTSYGPYTIIFVVLFVLSYVLRTLYIQLFSSCYSCCRTSYGPYTIVFVMLCVLSYVQWTLHYFFWSCTIILLFWCSRSNAFVVLLHRIGPRWFCDFDAQVAGV